MIPHDVSLNSFLAYFVFGFAVGLGWAIANLIINAVRRKG